MKNTSGIIFIFCLVFFSPKAHSEINLKVKIQRIFGSKTIELVKTISANYGQEIVIMPEGKFNDKIIFKLQKFKDVLVNGNKINPVQIDMRIVNNIKNKMQKTRTVTSFYNQSAQFDSPDMNVSLKFEEI